METVYRITGIIVVWGIIITLTGILAFLIGGIIWYRLKLNRVYEWVIAHIKLYVLRNTIPTDLLREAYKLGYRKHVANYRLRNIKQLKKG